MKKKVGIIKRIFALLLIFLLSINSFAAVVSDNDGSAFITKAEFDSLKNNFQAQIDQYNQSIDSKIDGAIASYLAGIKLNEKIYYRVFGYDAGIWKGEKCNSFYIQGVNNSPWNHLWENCFAVMDKGGRTNRGYGYGYFVNGFRFSDTKTTLSGLPDGQLGFFAQQGLKTMQSGELQYGLNWTQLKKSGVISLGSDVEKQDVCSMGLSDAFQSLIPLIDPSFTLMEFLDSGNVNTMVAPIWNGYDYEGGEHEGTNSPQFSKVILYLESGGTLTELKQLTSSDDRKKVEISCEVNAGDKLVVRDFEPYNTGTGLAYSIFFFNNTIPGWTKKD